MNSSINKLLVSCLSLRNGGLNGTINLSVRCPRHFIKVLNLCVKNTRKDLILYLSRNLVKRAYLRWANF